MASKVLPPDKGFKVKLEVSGPPTMAGDYGFSGPLYDPKVSVDLMIHALNMAMESGMTLKECKKLVERAFNSTRFTLPKKKLKVRLKGRKRDARLGISKSEER